MTVYATRLMSDVDTAERMRLSDSMTMVPRGPLNSRTGIRPGGGSVSVVDSTMDVEVDSLIGWINGDSAPQQGGYPVVVDDTETLTLSDGDATGDRIDLIVVRVYDSNYDGGGSQDVVIEAVEGVPGDPSAPDVPDTSLPLRSVTIPAGASTGNGGLTSANLGSDFRPYTSGLGGIIPVQSATARNALTLVPGQAALQLDNGSLYVCDGSKWQPVSDPENRPQAGTFTGHANGNGERHATDITFARPFSAPPIVHAQPQDVSWVDTVDVGAYNISTTGFRLRYIRQSGAGDITCGWVAIPATQ